MAEREIQIFTSEVPEPIKVVREDDGSIRLIGRHHEFWVYNPERMRKVAWAILDLTDDIKTEETDR